MAENENINVEQEKKTRNINKKALFIGAIALVVALAIIIGIVVMNKDNGKEEEVTAEAQQVEVDVELEQEYRDRMIEAMAYMLINVSGGATYVATYLDILVEYPSLDQATVEGIMVSSFAEVLDYMEEYDDIVVADMKWLSNNKISKYNDTYEVLLDMYDNYRVFYDGTVNLQVTSEASSNRLLEKGENVLEKYNRILIIMPELEDGVENKQDTITT